MNRSIFLGGRPDIAQEDRIALPVFAERLAGQILRHAAGQRIGDDERRRGEIIGLRVRAHPAFEIAIAREHRGGDDPVVVDRLGDLVGERAGIADAGRAAEADEIETELVEILLQAGIGEIFADDLRTRRKRRLHPRLRAQPLGHGVAGEQPRRDEDARIRRIGAGRDRGDHHVAVAEIEIAAFDREALGRLAGLFVFALQGGDEARADGFERHAALRTFRSGERRHDRRKIEIERFGENRIRRRSGAEETLGLGIFLDERDARIGAPRHGEIGDRFTIDRKEPAGRAIFGRHIGDRGAVGEGRDGRARGRRIRRICRRRPSCAASASR